MKDLLWSTIKAFLNIFYFKAHWPSKNETVYWFPQKICGFPFVVVYITVSSNDFLRLILCAWNWDQIVVPLKSYPKAVTIIREFIATFCHSRTNWREIFIVSSALHRLTNGKRNTCCVVPQISLIREYLGGKWWQQYFIGRQKSSWYKDPLTSNVVVMEFPSLAVRSDWCHACCCHWQKFLSLIPMRRKKVSVLLLQQLSSSSIFCLLTTHLNANTDGIQNFKRELTYRFRWGGFMLSFQSFF